MAKMKKKNQQQDFKRSLRFQSLKKKLNELTLLCNVDAFLLCSDQHGTGNSVLRSSYSWPEDQRSFLSLIHKYNNYSKEENKKKKRNDGINIDFGFDMTGFQSSMENLGSDEIQGMLYRIEWKKRKVSAMLHSLKQNNQIFKSRISDEECCENHDSLLLMNEGSDMWSGWACRVVFYSTQRVPFDNYIIKSALPHLFCRLTGEKNGWINSLPSSTFLGRSSGSSRRVAVSSSRDATVAGNESDPSRSRTTVASA